MTDYSLESYDFKALAKKERDKRIYQRLMKAIGLSWVSTRAKHPKQDEQAQ